MHVGSYRPGPLITGRVRYLPAAGILVNGRQRMRGESSGKQWQMAYRRLPKITKSKMVRSYICPLFGRGPSPIRQWWSSTYPRWEVRTRDRARPSRGTSGPTTAYRAACWGYGSLSAVGSQHLLRPQMGFRAQQFPQQPPNRVEAPKPLVCGSFLVAAAGMFGASHWFLGPVGWHKTPWPLTEWVPVGLCPLLDQILGMCLRKMQLT